jgi:hypothetical protein
MTMGKAAVRDAGKSFDTTNAMLGLPPLSQDIPPAGTSAEK